EGAVGRADEAAGRPDDAEGAGAASSCISSISSTSKTSAGAAVGFFFFGGVGAFALAFVGAGFAGFAVGRALFFGGAFIRFAFAAVVFFFAGAFAGFAAAFFFAGVAVFFFAGAVAFFFAGAAGRALALAGFFDDFAPVFFFGFAMVGTLSLIWATRRPADLLGQSGDHRFPVIAMDRRQHRAARRNLDELEVFSDEILPGVVEALGVDEGTLEDVPEIFFTERLEQVIAVGVRLEETRHEGFGQERAPLVVRHRRVGERSEDDAGLA